MRLPKCGYLLYAYLFVKICYFDQILNTPAHKSGTEYCKIQNHVRMSAEASAAASGNFWLFSALKARHFRL